MPEPADLTPEERDLMAAELALGVLEGEERAQALRLQLSDPAFADAVARWAEQLGPMHAAVAPVTPSEALWPAIAARLAAQPVASATVPDADVLPLRRRLAAWRLGAIGSGAVAAALALVLVTRPEPQPVEVVRAPDQIVLAQLAGEGEAQFAARYDPQPGALRIRTTGLKREARMPELWVIPADGVPRSLGLIAADGIATVQVPARLRGYVSDGATLAVTLEPVEGAPHQAPSSTPIAVGKISII